MGAKILIIDDEEDIIFLLSSRLKTHNYEVIAATSGKEGLEAIKTQKPDLVITDVLMPDMTGYQMVEALQDEPAEIRDTPIIVISAKPSMKEYFSLNENLIFLPKPYDDQKILDSIEQLLAQKKGGAAKPEKAPAFTTSDSSGASAGTKKKVLIVGVDEYAIEKARAHLEKQNCHVGVAHDEDDIIVRAASEKPAIVFVQFWEDSSRFDAGKVYFSMTKNEKTKGIKFVTFCVPGISLEAAKAVEAKIISYNDSADLLKQMEAEIASA